MATGLEFYRVLGNVAFQQSEETQYFTQTINDIFDGLNARFPKTGIRMNSPSYKVIEFFKL